MILFAIGPIGAALISFATLPLLAWTFPAESIGKLVLLQITISFSFSLSSLALEQVYVREFYDCINGGRLLKTTFIPGFAIAVSVIFSILLFGIDLGEILYGENISIAVYMISLAVVINYASVFIMLVLRMNERALHYSVISIFSKLLFLGFVASAVFLDIDRTFESLLKFHLLAMCLTLAIAIFAARDYLVIALKVTGDWPSLRGYLKFSTPLIFGGLAYWGLTVIDRVSIKWWSSFEQLGIYSIAVGFAGVAVLVQSIFTTMWTPVVYRWNAEGLDTQKLNDVGQHVLAVVVIIYSMVGGFSWVVGYLIPEEYSIVPYILPACIGAPLLYMLSETTVVGLHLSRRTFYSMLAPLIALAVNVAMNILIVPIYGAAGAAAVTSFSFFIFLLARTEFSAMVWQSFPRIKIYFYTFLCTALASLQAMYHEVLEESWFFIWWGMLAMSLWVFKNSLALFYGSILIRFKKFV